MARGTYVPGYQLPSLRDSDEVVRVPGTYVPGYQLPSLRDSDEFVDVTQD